MVDKKERGNVCGTKEGLHRVYTGHRTTPQQLKSVYTGRDKATIENYLKFVSIVINRMRQQFTVGDLSCCGATSSVDSITDYNEFYSILLQEVGPV